MPLFSHLSNTIQGRLKHALSKYSVKTSVGHSKDASLERLTFFGYHVLYGSFLYISDELIRQVTVNCAERGLLLLRVRNEIKMTLAAYQTLYQSSIAFGMRKALQVPIVLTSYCI